MCNGLFVAFYRLAMHQRISFRIARVFLVGSLVAAAVIPAFDIPVWRSEPIVLHDLDLATMPYAAENPLTLTGQADHWQTALWVVYGLGIAALISIMIFQSVKIRRLKRRAEVFAAGEYEVAVSPEVRAPFSFLSTVYIEQGTPVDEMRQILLHETSHIHHRHSVEKIIMETLKTLMWFNPFAWIASRLLNEVHEFEADRDVLQGGCTVEEYLPVIFRQVFGYIPEISTGLGNSLTKKRFEMMTKNLKHRKYSWLRAAGVLPIAAGMLMLFGFTHRAPEIIMQQPDAQKTPAKDDVVVIGHKEKPETTTSAEKDNVVVVGYGTKPKTTGEITAIAASSNGNIIIRGEGNPPMFWINGENREITPEEFGKLTPDTIESISVLKDNASYPEEVRKAIGDRKFDGVIIIELKKGGSDPAPAGVQRKMVIVEDQQGKTKKIEETVTSSGITIRKSETGTDTNMPLMFVDDKEAGDGALSKIDPDQIESFTVLKDSATAVYGERGANGVILVKTKKEGSGPGQNAAPAAKNDIIQLPDYHVIQKNDGYYKLQDAKIFYWFADEKREITKDDLRNEKFSKDVKVSYMSLTDKTKLDSKYADAIAAMGKREFDGVIVIELKKEGLVVIRDFSAITPNEPLKIIDGRPVSEEVFAKLTPDDIESFSVLKDASATALYGSRAANGVIVVTTKKKDGNTPYSAAIDLIKKVGGNSEALALKKPRVELAEGKSGRTNEAHIDPDRLEIISVITGKALEKEIERCKELNIPTGNADIDGIVIMRVKE